MDKTILRAGIACACVVTLLALLNPGSARAASFDPFFQTSFTADTIADWAIASGNRRIVNGEFVNNSEGALSIATVPTYERRSAGDVPNSLGSDFSLDVYASIVSSAANARVGVVFDFAGPGNYSEVTVSAMGNAQLRVIVT